MTSSWWASKLGVQPSVESRPQPVPVFQRTPAPQQYPSYVQPVQEDRIEPNAQIDIMTAVSRYKGTKAAQAIESCPSCGSPHVFAVTTGGVLGNAPAPRCTACGWNGGKFEQGDQASWLV